MVILTWQLCQKFLLPFITAIGLVKLKSSKLKSKQKQQNEERCFVQILK